MTKNMEPFEEDFMLDEQNSNEEPLIEEDEDEEEALLRIKPRPARASLTHNAIKSELLKMNKQYNSQRLDSGEDNDENLSRSARKRKKRREKVLEERRASGGRGDNFEDDLAHFKSIPISRRRSSILPSQTIVSPTTYNGDEGGFCEKVKCFFWLFFIVGTLIGLIYVWPTVAELEVEIAEQTSNQESNDDHIQIDVNQAINNAEVDIEQIIYQMNKLEDELGDNSNDEQKNTNDEPDDSLTTFGYLSSFFGSESPAPIEEPDEQLAQDNVEQNNEIQNEQDAFDEQTVEPTSLNDEEIDERSEEFVDHNDAIETTEFENENNHAINDQQMNEEIEKNFYESVPERYQPSVNEDNDEPNDDHCMIGGQLYANLDGEQCSILQQRHHQLEQQLQNQEQIMQQDQQDNDNEEQFYFF